MTRFNRQGVHFGRRTKAITVIGLIVIGLCPFPMQVSTQFIVRAADKTGVTIAGIRITRSWENYASGEHGDELKFTDGEGIARFEKHIISRILLGQIVPFITPLIAVHASGGGSDTSFDIAWPDGYEFSQKHTVSLLVSRWYTKVRDGRGEFISFNMMEANHARGWVPRVGGRMVEFTVPLQKREPTVR